MRQHPHAPVAAVAAAVLSLLCSAVPRPASAAVPLITAMASCHDDTGNVFYGSGWTGPAGQAQQFAIVGLLQWAPCAPGTLQVTVYPA